MRRLVSKGNEKKRQKRNQIILSIALLVIMFFSVLGYAFQGNSEESSSLKYNGFSFVKSEGYWYVSVEGMSFVFQYSPKEVEKINSELNNLEKYSREPLYVYSEDYESYLEVYRNLFYRNSVVQRVQEACPNEEIFFATECSADVPVKNCEDNFIILKKGEESSITQIENCVIIEGPEEELVKLSDEFLFKILGIREQ